MAAERGRHVVLIGLEVTDDAGYVRYRAGMTPILEAYSGSFGCDVDAEIDLAPEGGAFSLAARLYVSLPGMEAIEAKREGR